MLDNETFGKRIAIVSHISNHVWKVAIKDISGTRQFLGIYYRMSELIDGLYDQIERDMQ